MVITPISGSSASKNTSQPTSSGSARVIKPISTSGTVYKPNAFVQSQPIAPIQSNNISMPSSGSKFIDFAPSTMRALADLQIDPLGFKANPAKSFGDWVGGIEGSIKAAGESLRRVFTNDKKTPPTPSQRVGAGSEAVARTVGAVFSPITSLFAAANDFPIIASIAKAATIPFAALGDAGRAVAYPIVNTLPISREAKENIIDGVSEITSLAAQMIIGGKVIKVPKVIKKDLVTKYGERDATTIATQAEKMAKENLKTPQSKGVVNRNVNDLVSHEGAPDKAQIAIYKEEIQAGGRPPLIVIKEGKKFGIEDGKHKYEAYKELGIEEIPTIEKKGTSNEAVSLVEEALSSGDIEAAKAIYEQLPKGEYLPSFETIKQGVDRTQERQGAQASNQEAVATKESYGQHAETVGKMKALLRTSAEKKSSSGELYREHIPQDKFGIGSDEIATDLGMSESAFMQKINSELDIKKQPVPKAVKEVEVPRSQLPVGEGKQKVSRLEARTKGVLGKATQEQKEQLGLSTYNVMNNEAIIKKASEYVVNNPKEALKVLQGQLEPPPGLNSNSIFVAMANHPELSSELAVKLASLKSTAMGQNIEILKALDPNNPVNIASEIYKIKEETFQKRYGGKTVKQVTDSYIKKGEAKIAPPKLTDWSSLIKEVRC